MALEKRTISSSYDGSSCRAASIPYNISGSTKPSGVRELVVDAGFIYLSSQFGLEATRKRQSALSVAAVYIRIDPQSFQPAISGSLDGCTLIATLESFSPTTGLCVVRADRPYRRSAGRPCA